MTMMIRRPPCCSICGYYLTTDKQYIGHRCVDPAHWVAVGVLTPRDYFQMAKIAAGQDRVRSMNGTWGYSFGSVAPGLKKGK